MEHKEGEKGLKHVRLIGNVRLVGVRVEKSGEKRRVCYYLKTDNNDFLYAFSRNYSRHTYDLCKSGIRVNDLIRRRTRDTAVMNLVDYMNLMLPYLAEIYDLPCK